MQGGGGGVGGGEGGNNRQTGKARRKRMVGEREKGTANTAETLGGQTVDGDSGKLVQRAEASPAVQQAKAQQVAAQAQYRAAHAPYFPNISVAYNRARYHSDSSFNFANGGYRYSGTLRFTLSYPLFNGLTREQDVVTAQVAEQHAAAVAQDAALLAQQNLVA